MSTNAPARRTNSNAAAQQSRPPAPAAAEQTVQEMIRSSWSAIAASLPDTMDSKRFARLVFNAVRKTPRLAEATSTSMVGAVLTASALGLEIGLNNEAHLVPYKRTTKDKSREWVEAQLIVGYGGVVKLFQQHPAARGVTTGWVGKNDRFDFAYGTAAFLDHKPAFGDRGEPVAFWAAYELANGTRDFLVLDPATVAKLRDKPLDEKRDVADPEHWMERKTVLKQVLKLAPKSTKLQWAMAVDEKPGGDLQRERVAVAIAAGDVVPDQAAIDPQADDVEGDIDEATGEVLGGDAPTEQVPEGTGGGEASVPAGADNGRVAGGGGSAGARPTQKTRPAVAEDPDSSTDAPAPASQAGAGDEPPAEPAPAAGGSSAPVVQQYQPEPDQHAQEPAEPQPEPVHTPGPILTRQKNELRAECARLGIQSNTAEKLMWLELIVGMPDGSLQSSDALNRPQAEAAIEKLKSFPDHAALEAWGAGQATLDEPAEG